MENNDLQSKALSHIPKHLVDSMLKETKVDTVGLSPLEVILKDKGKPLPAPAQVPQQEQTIMVAIDSNVIQVPADSFKSLVTMLAYYMATVGYKDKKINKILKAFNFKMSDCNGIPIYPREKKK